MSDRSDSHRAYNRAYYQKTRLVRGVKLRLQAAKRRASELGLPFELNEEDVATPEVCPICGTGLVMRVGSGGGNSSPSIDRVVPALGYTKSNTVVICQGCNRKKDNSTAEELSAIADYIYRIREERGLC